MQLIKLFRLMAACAIALAALSAHARQAEALHAQNMPLEKIQWLDLDCPRVWLAQAVDSHQENTYVYGEGVSEPTLYNYFRNYQPNQGRYTQADPIGLEGGINRFGYADVDALNSYDPDGLVKKSAKPETVVPIMGGGRAMPKGGEFKPVPFPGELLGGARPATGKFCESPSLSDAWKGMSNYRDGIKTNGATGKQKEFYKWDHTHGDIEVFDRNGNHLGSMNPNTGVMHKPPVPGRTL